MSILLVVALALTGCQVDVDAGGEKASARAGRESGWAGVGAAGLPSQTAQSDGRDSVRGAHPAQAEDAGTLAPDTQKTPPAVPASDAGALSAPPGVADAPSAPEAVADTQKPAPVVDKPEDAAAETPVSPAPDAAAEVVGPNDGGATPAPRIPAPEAGAKPRTDPVVAADDEPVAVPAVDEQPDGDPAGEAALDKDAGVAADAATDGAAQAAAVPDAGRTVSPLDVGTAAAQAPRVVVGAPPPEAEPEAEPTGSGSGVLNILLLLGLIIAAFLTTHFIVRFAGRKWFLASPGLPYLVIGVLVGPAVLDVISASNLSKLQPAVMVGIGSIGLLAGLRLNFRRMWGLLEYEHLRSAGWIAALTALGVGLPATLLMTWYVGGAWTDLSVVWFIAPPALLIVATALVSGTTPIQYTVERYKAKGWMSTFAIYVAEFSEVLGILVFSLVFAIANHGATFSGIELDLLGWLLIQVGVGILFGILFTWFIGGDDDKEKLLVALLGIIVFSSGVAYFLRLSPLLITFFVGLVLANFSGFAERIRTRLEAVEKPFFIVIFFFAGMQLVPSITWWSLLFIPAYALLRWGGKSLGGELAFRTSARGEHVIRGVGSALVSQGGLAVAMVLSYMQVVRSTPSVGSAMYQANMAPGFAEGMHGVHSTAEVVPLDLVGNVIDPAVSITSIVCTVIIACIIINDTFSFISTRNLLINAGEIDPDVDVVPEDIYAHPELADMDLVPPEASAHPPGEGR